MLLHHLLQQFDPQINLAGIPDIEILGISEDSRHIRTGDVFVARPGTKTNGADYITQAHARGAVAVITQKKFDYVPLPQIVIADQASASVLANVFHSQPSHSLKVLGVTGTNGKTTTTYLIRHLLKTLNQRCGMIGTVEIDDGRSTREATMTTPGPVELADLIASMRNKGCRACAIEVSSHALHQRRAAGVTFAGVGFTNLTGDHLDYHGTMDEYAAAKAMLFETLHTDAVAAVNVDDEWSKRMVANCHSRIIRFGMSSKDADYRAKDIAVTSAGSSFILHSPDGRAEVSMQLIGKHNIQNALCAAAIVGESLGATVHQIAAGLRDAQGAPGRLQSVRHGQPFAVLVDYAHTDDALENVLSALKPLTKGRLRVVFGCGGDRDRTKRPRMARTAANFGDVIYVTSDNPRTENPKSIIDEIVSGLPADSAESNRLFVEADRRSAIEKALTDAEPNDVVLIAGKGHENYQIIGTQKHHFDDVEETT
ncbi:MAG: UDP-N-acetylmuramoyl-L-alanyl-D-glutamate--2,6-diaminopimelate ligase, partial [Anaerolineae bacterium]|nr:UDP-N-acetylmuramoyl-L-alanyl-D-glutamate--2,6-diaminopimelate ligase [Phycisphaerae bacterium]